MNVNEEHNIIEFYLRLREFGFHSEKKKLGDIFTPEQTAEFVEDSLRKVNIIEIEVHMSLEEGKNMIVSDQITLLSPTSSSLNMAFPLVFNSWRLAGGKM